MEAQSTVEKAVDVLFHLHAEPHACGVTAIGRTLGLSKSSTHRLLTALSRRGLVEKDDRGRYRPGIGLVALGVGALDREPVVAAARPILEAEAQALGVINGYQHPGRLGADGRRRAGARRCVDAQPARGLAQHR